MAPMPDPEPVPHQRELAAQLIDAIAVRRDTDSAGDHFTGVAPDWFGERVFGGLIVGQALWAAMATVSPELAPHSLRGTFLRAVQPPDPVGAVVDRVRDGRTFTTRQVSLSQGGKICFTATASFCVEEVGEEYQMAMEHPPPAAGALAPPTGEWLDPWELRDAGPSPQLADGTYSSTGRRWLRFPAGVAGDDASTHVALLAFLSDVTGSSFRPHSLDTWGAHTDASLDHCVWFHRPVRADNWLCFDLHALITHANRSLVRGAMHTEAGDLCLSMAQELLIRPLG